MSDAGAHVVVVDDEADVRDMLQEYLVRHGYHVSQAADGVALRALMSVRPADLVLLDVNMPGEDGVSLARWLRSLGPVGIVMLTANGDTVDRVVGLEVGADDYVVKPFEPRELLARLRSVLRRVARDAPAATMGDEIVFGRCRLNLDSRALYGEDGLEVPITAMEYDLLAAFARNPNRVMSRDRLLELAHNRDLEPFDRSIDIRVARLRKKIEPDPTKPETIKTVRGGGYVFVPSGARRT